MKAIVIHQHGDPSVLRYTDVPEPHLRPREVLVRVHACALNYLDLWVRRGLPGVAIPLPHIPGSDIAGEVAKVGPEVTTVHVGQKVVLAPGSRAENARRAFPETIIFAAISRTSAT